MYFNALMNKTTPCLSSTFFLYALYHSVYLSRIVGFSSSSIHTFDIRLVLVISLKCIRKSVLVRERPTVGVRIKRGYGCGTERIDGTDMRIKRGAYMRIKRGADMRIKRGADMRIKRGADMRIKRGWVVFCAN